MNTNYDFYSGWGWVLWFGFIALLFSNAGTWGYTYSSHRRVRDMFAGKDSLDFLSERYAKGELDHDQYLKMKAEIVSTYEQRLELKRRGERQGLASAPASI